MDIRCHVYKSLRMGIRSLFKMRSRNNTRWRSKKMCQIKFKDLVIDEERQYWHYVNGHMFAVRDAWKTLQEVCRKELWLADDYTWAVIDGRVKCHDDSKLKGEEFSAYRLRFYPDEHGAKIGNAAVERLFRRAWNHHQNANPHHWEYWCLIDDEVIVPLEMPFEYIIEMLLDWTAMSVYFNNVPSRWYAKNKSGMQLHPETERVINLYMPFFDEVYERMTD